MSTNNNSFITTTPIVGQTNESLRGDTKIPSSAETLSVALTLLRNKKTANVESSEPFVKNDGVRLNISVVEKGYLFVLYKGNDGETQILFPSKDYFDGKNEAEPNVNIVIPRKGWFFFDEKKGTETIFVVFSKTQNLAEFKTNPKQTVESFEKVRREKNADTFSTVAGDLVRVIELKHE